MTANGTTAASVPAYDLARESLNQWNDALPQLDLALTDAAFARDRLADINRQMEIEEARTVLETVGGNAETRKAAATLYLNEQSAVYLIAQQRQARLDIADADGRAEIARQRCRLLRVSAALARL